LIEVEKIEAEVKEKWQTSAPKSLVEGKANKKVQKGSKVKTDWKRRRLRNSK